MDKAVQKGPSPSYAPSQVSKAVATLGDDKVCYSAGLFFYEA
ncbi:MULTISPECIES: hypothetical protein [unclassified Bartonella]